MMYTKTMAREHPDYPFAGSAAAQMLREAIDRKKKDGISLRALARQLGYKQPTVVSHMASGRAPIPLERVHDLAVAMQIDEANLALAVLAQRYPSTEWASLLTHGPSPDPAGADLLWKIEGALGGPISGLNADQIKVIIEVVTTQEPSRRWLSPLEAPTIELLRRIIPNFREQGLSKGEHEFLEKFLP